MSIKLMTACYERQLAPHLRQVLLVLCDHANDDGSSCHPSIPLIAWKLDLTQRAVMDSITALEQLGVLAVQRATGKVNHYVIRLDALPLKPAFERKTREAHFRGEESSGVKPTSGVPVKPTSGVGVKPTSGVPVKPTSPEPPVEPSKEPPGEPPLGAQRAKAKRATPVPGDFQVTVKLRQQAIAYGVPPARIDAETEAFLDFHRARGTVFKDWEAGWRTWMRNAVKFAGRASPHASNGNGKGPDASFFTDWARTLERQERER